MTDLAVRLDNLKPSKRMPLAVKQYLADPGEYFKTHTPAETAAVFDKVRARLFIDPKTLDPQMAADFARLEKEGKIGWVPRSLLGDLVEADRAAPGRRRHEGRPGRRHDQQRVPVRDPLPQARVCAPEHPRQRCPQHPPAGVRGHPEPCSRVTARREARPRDGRQDRRDDGGRDRAGDQRARPRRPLRRRRLRRSRLVEGGRHPVPPVGVPV